MARKLFILTVGFAILGYLIYDTIPDGYSTSSSLRLRMVQAGGNFGRFLSSTVQKLGLANWYEISRPLCRFSRHFVPQPNDDVVRWYDAVLDGVPVRVYEPRERTAVLPGFVYYHGGGWVICDIDSHHAFTHELALKTNTVLISVSYRLAPEHPFPIPSDDCLKATKAFINNAKQFNIDPKRIAIGGDSAGGNLAASVALRLRDEQFTPEVKVQVLIYPTLQLIDMMLPSMIQNANGIVITRTEMRNMSPLYLLGKDKYGEEIMRNGHIPLALRRKLSEGVLSLKRLPTKYTQGFTRPEPEEPSKELWNEIKSTVLNPYYNPMLAPNATGLPATYIYTGEHDVLRDDGFLYEYKLKEAGNKVKHYHHDLGFHGIFQFGLDWPETQVAVQDVVQFIRENL